jgi:hypothetical protein
MPDQGWIDVGAPELTFDTPESAQEWIDENKDEMGDEYDTEKLEVKLKEKPQDGPDGDIKSDDSEHKGDPKYEDTSLDDEEDKRIAAAKRAGEKAAREQHAKDLESNSQDCKEAADKAEEARDAASESESLEENIQEANKAVAAAKESKQLADPRNKEDRDNAKRAADAAREAIDEALTEAASDNPDNLGEIMDELEDLDSQVTELEQPKKWEPKVSQCQGHAQQAQDLADRASERYADDELEDAAGDADDSYEEAKKSRESCDLDKVRDRQAALDAAKAAEQALRDSENLIDDAEEKIEEMMAQQDDPDLLNPPAKWGIWSIDESDFVPGAEYNSEKEASDAIDSMYGNQSKYQPRLLPDPAKEAAEKAADEGEIDPDNPGEEEGFCEGFEEEMDRLSEGKEPCIITNLEGVTTDPDAIEQFMAFVQLFGIPLPPIKELPIKDYVFMHLHPKGIEFGDNYDEDDEKGDPNDWSVVDVPAWIPEDFGPGFEVEVVSDDSIDAVVTSEAKAPISELIPNAVWSLKLKKGNLSCFEEAPPDFTDSILGHDPQPSELSKVMSEAKKQPVKSNVGKVKLSKWDPNQKVMVNWDTGEVKQFTQAEMLDGSAGPEWEETRFITLSELGIQVVAAIPGAIEILKSLNFTDYIEVSPVMLEINNPTPQISDLMGRLADPLIVNDQGNKITLEY